MNARSISTTLLFSMFIMSCKKDCDQPIPERCQVINYDPSYNDPVCGCDDKTYTNNFVAECEFGILDHTPGACMK